MKKIIFLIILMMTMQTSANLFAELRSSVSQFGITWTFDREYECGQFANGDWWVKGPVVVEEIYPRSAVVNGRTIYDSKGKEIITLWNQHEEPGIVPITWYSRDSSNNKVGSGVYMVHMKVGSYSETKKIAVIK